jgi:hypothetical protein
VLHIHHKWSPTTKTSIFWVKLILNNIATFITSTRLPTYKISIIIRISTLHVSIFPRYFTFYIYILHCIFWYFTLIKKWKRDLVILRCCQLYRKPLLSYSLKMASWKPKHCSCYVLYLYNKAVLDYKLIYFINPAICLISWSPKHKGHLHLCFLIIYFNIPHFF